MSYKVLAFYIPKTKDCVSVTLSIVTVQDNEVQRIGEDPLWKHEGPAYVTLKDDLKQDHYPFATIILEDTESNKIFLNYPSGMASDDHVYFLLAKTLKAYQDITNAAGVLEVYVPGRYRKNAS